MGYQHEESRKRFLAILAYKEILERFPESDVAIKAIDKLEKLKR
jgi:hypothetical protein